MTASAPHTLETDMNYFFPNLREVFAYWFSGELRIPMGKEIHYVHMVYESVFEKDLIIQVENGRIISINDN